MSSPRAGRACDGALLLFAVALPLSIAVSEIALGLAVLAWLATRPWTRPLPPGVAALGLATLALAATWLLASATAADPWASLVKARKLYSIVIVFLVADRARQRRHGDRLAAAALVGGGLSAGFGLAAHGLDLLAGPIPFHRLESVFSNAMTSGNVYATLAVAGLGALLAAREGARARLLAGVAFALVAAALLATLTRSAWLAFLAGAGVLLLRLRPRLLLAVTAALALLVALGPFEIRSRALSVVDPTHPTNAGRVSLWKSGLVAFSDHAWTGVGLADHYALIETYRRPDATFHAGHFHNNLVQIAVSTGGLGLVAYLAWMGLLAVLLVRASRGGGWSRGLVGLAVWGAFQVHGLFDWSFGDAEVVNQFFLWTGLGLATLAPGARAVPPEGPATSLAARP